MSDTPRLISPHKNYASSYAEALRDGMETHHVSAEEIYRIETDFDGWWKNENDLSVPVILGNGSAVPRVPQSLFWLVFGDHRFLGRISVRHELSAFLRIIGGHIGYAVRVDERKKGYGHLMMELVKPHVRDIGITPAMMTCNEENEGSIRIIEKAGGVLDEKFPHPHSGVMQRRYWLDI